MDAKTGKIVSTQVETPEDQAKEAAADKKEKKSHARAAGDHHAGGSQLNEG